MELTILYRGPLVSCNYACAYCPFAKRRESAEERARDEAALDRFRSWLEARPATDELRVLFTPWGEAMVRRAYRETIARLTHVRSVRVVGVQTNLSGPLDFLSRARPEKVRLWCTYHPEQVDRARFVERVRNARTLGAPLSVGIVGFRRFFDEVRALRAELPDDVYLWINVPKSSDERLSEAELDSLAAIDPHVRINAVRHPSLDAWCDAGLTSVSVDGDGTVRRCHFVTPPLGNLYTDDIASLLEPRRCPNVDCHCHIGYVHLPHLGMDDTFEAESLFRIPRRYLPVIASTTRS